MSVPPNLKDNLERTLSGYAPPLLDGAALAAGWKTEADILRREMGQLSFHAWLSNAEVHPGSPNLIMVDKEFRAKRLREVYAGALDKAFTPGGWLVASKEWEARRAA